MWELDHKESWSLKNRCFWIVVLEKTFESPLDCKEIKLVNPKGNQYWIFIGRTDAETEAPNFGHLIQRTDSLEKTWCWGRLKAGGEGDDRGWDGQMALPTRWTWPWISSRSWWWIGKAGVQQSMEVRRVRHNWVTDLNGPCCMSKFPLTCCMFLSFNMLYVKTYVKISFLLSQIIFHCMSHFVHTLVAGHWVTSIFWLMWITAPWTQEHMFESLRSLLLGMYPEVELLNHMVILGLIFLRNMSSDFSTSFSMSVMFWDFCCCLKRIAILMNVKWYLIGEFVFCIIGVGGIVQFALMDFSCCHKLYFIFAVSLSLDFPTSCAASLLTSYLETTVPSDPLLCTVELKLWP